MIHSLWMWKKKQEQAHVHKFENQINYLSHVPVKKVIGRHVGKKSLTLSIITNGRFGSGKLGRAGLNSRIQNELGHLYRVLVFRFFVCLLVFYFFMCLFSNTKKNGECAIES